MNNEDKMFDLITKMYSDFSDFKKDMIDFKEDMTDFKEDMTGFKKDMTDFRKDITGKSDSLEDGQSILVVAVKEIKETVDSINKTVIRIENDHGEKLSALFDGWKQNTERLDRIEKEVSRQDEVILRKIK